MTWYAAHMIQYFKKKQGVQKSYLVWENVVLIEATTPTEAWQIARQIGEEEYGDDGDESLKIDGEPAVSVFGGIRKLIECMPTVVSELDWNEDFKPGHLTEITYSGYEVDIEELPKLINGEMAVVTYQDDKNFD
jgi:hypothetical protein